MTASESRPPGPPSREARSPPAPAASASLSQSSGGSLHSRGSNGGRAREHGDRRCDSAGREPRWVLATAARRQASSFRGWRGRGRVGARGDTRGSPAAGILLLTGRGGCGARRSAPARGHRGSGTSALRSGTAGSGTATQCHANLGAARRLSVDARSKAPAAATAAAAATTAEARGLGPADDTARIVPRLSDGPSLPLDPRASFRGNAPICCARPDPPAPSRRHGAPRTRGDARPTPTATRQRPAPSAIPSGSHSPVAWLRWRARGLCTARPCTAVYGPSTNRCRTAVRAEEGARARREVTPS